MDWARSARKLVTASVAVALVCWWSPVAVASVAPTLLVSGVLTGAGGLPTSGVVVLQAWPDPLPTSVGSTFSMIDLAEQAVDGQGSYAFNSAQISVTPQLQAIAAANGGRVNLQVLGLAPGRTGEQNFVRTLSNAHWSPLATNSVLVTLRMRAPPSAYAAARALLAERLASRHTAVPPMDPPPSCASTVIGSLGHSARVGELHRWNGETSDFYYGQTADSDYGVGISTTGTSGWTLSGDVHVANKLGSEIHISMYSALDGRYMLSSFQFLKIHTQWNGVGLRCIPYTVRVSRWNGGTGRGTNFHDTPDGMCNLAPSASRVQFAAGTDFSRASHRAWHYHVAATVFGASLDGVSGYSTDVQMHYHFHASEWACGEDRVAPPTTARAVAVGPEVRAG